MIATKPRSVLSAFLGIALGSTVGCAVSAPTGDGDGSTDVPAPSADALPDFALLDVNANSARYLETVSPREYLGKISAWYFGHAT